MPFNASMLRPVNQLVQKYGVKAVVYGGPGTGKTPLMMTAPNACHGFSEPGLLSVQDSVQWGTVIDTGPRIVDFVKWCCTSQEARYFETKCLDSLSQMADIFLNESMRSGKNNDPRSWYGDMGKAMMELMNMIYYAPDNNFIMIAKQGSVEFEGVTKSRPYFPGNQLNVEIPHLFDSVWHMEKMDQNGKKWTQIRTQENYSSFARDRSGKLAEIEHPNLTYLIQKART